MDKKDIILYLIDFQNDFVLEEGALPVKGAISDVKRFLEDIEFLKNRIKAVNVSKDHHLEDAIWFEGNAPKDYDKQIWKPHCIEFTEGCKLHSDIDNFLFGQIGLKHRNVPIHFYYKGYNTEYEQYSLFTPLEEGCIISEEEANDLFSENINYFIFAGEALDYCVYNSIKDFIKFVKIKTGLDIQQKIIISNLYSSPIGNYSEIENKYKDLGVILSSNKFSELIK